MCVHACVHVHVPLPTSHGSIMNSDMIFRLLSEDTLFLTLQYHFYELESQGIRHWLLNSPRCQWCWAHWFSGPNLWCSLGSKGAREWDALMWWLINQEVKAPAQGILGKLGEAAEAEKKRLKRKLCFLSPPRAWTAVICLLSGNAFSK